MSGAGIEAEASKVEAFIGRCWGDPEAWAERYVPAVALGADTGSLSGIERSYPAVRLALARWFERVAAALRASVERNKPQ